MITLTKKRINQTILKTYNKIHMKNDEQERELNG